VSPHHLFFNTDSIDENNLSFKMNPPIRSKSDQDALWQALIDGTIDFVATDHAPHESLKKTGQLSTQRLVEVFAKNPAGFLSLPNGFGEFTNAYEFHGERIF
jgi:dihydroorotase-like cyclic amidohydrolase